MARAKDLAVLVTGIPEGTTDGAIKLLFKNETKSGGGEIENIQYFKEEGKAVVTYEDNSIAQRVAAKKRIEYRGKPLSVTTIPANKWDKKTILVTSSSDIDMSVEQLELIFESKRKSGGGPIESLEIKPGVGAFITFEEEKDAASVLQRQTVKMESITYTAKIPPMSSSNLWDKVTVQISGLTPNIHKDDLQLVYEEKEESGGGPIESLNILDDNTALIVFMDEEDAAAVLEKEIVEWEGAQLKASKPKNTAKQARTTEERKCLVVKGIDPQWRESKLRLFFKNKNMTGGSDVRSVRMNATNELAVISFVDNNVPESVLQKHQSSSLMLSDKLLDIEICNETEAMEKLDEPVESVPAKKVKSEFPKEPQVKPKVKAQPTKEPQADRSLNLESCAIAASNLPDNITEELLIMFFEVEKQSGGGPTEGIIFDPETKKAVITYVYSNAAKKVLAKYQSEGLNIEGTPIRISHLKPTCGEIEVTEDHEPNTICIKNLTEDTEAGDIQHFLESHLKPCRVKEIFFGTVQGAALVQFSKFPDCEHLYELACQKPLKTKMVDIEAVDKTNIVEVYGIEDLSSQRIQMYFEHSSSNGGDVIQVKLYAEEDMAKVIFEKHEVAVKVCKKYNHKIEQKDLTVKLHYECIGVIQSDEDRGANTKSSKTVKMHVSDSRILEFLQQKSHLKVSIDHEMNAIGAEVLWDDINRSEIQLRCLPKSPVKLKGEAREKYVKENFENIISKYCAEDIGIAEESWREFLTEFQKVQYDHSAIKVEVHSDTFFVSLVGMKDVVGKTVENVTQIKSSIEQTMKRKKDVTSKTTQCDPISVKLLQLLKFEEQIEGNFEDMKVVLHADKGEVKFTGIETDIASAKLKMYERMHSFCNERVKLSNQVHRFLQTWKASEYLQSKINSKGYVVTWTPKGNSEVLVDSATQGDLNSTVSLIKESFHEDMISLYQGQAGVGDPARTSSYIANFSSSHDRKVECYETESGSKLHIVGCDDVFQDAFAQLKRYLNDNTILCEEVSMQKSKAEYIKRFMRGKLDCEVAKYKKHQMYIRPNQNEHKPGFFIECNKGGLAIAKGILKDLENTIFNQEHNIRSAGAVRFFNDHTGQHYVSGLQQKHQVIIVMGHEAQSNNDYTLKYKAVYPNQKTLYIAQGDLTKFKVDAIVNAADPVLDHGGGVAKAIVVQGGKIIQTECTNYMRTKKRMDPGEVYVSTGGNLPCDKVIHTVGPKWAGGNQDEEFQLLLAVQAPVSEANNQGMTSIAMPAISTGKYGFPVDKACEILVEGVSSCLGEHYGGTLSEVYIVDNNSDVVQSCCNALCNNAGPRVRVENCEENDDSSLGAVGGAPASHSKYQAPAKPNFHRNSPRSSWTKGTDDCQVVTSEGIRISVENDSITDMKTEVIVNLTSTNLDLKNGIVSQSILKKAGPAIQQECHKKAPNGIVCGEMVVSSGGKYWENIYHGSCSHYTNGSAKQELQRYILACLEQAHNDKMSSIAFPSLGTGSLKFPPKESARIMFHEVKQFSSSNPTTTLQDIVFVVFDTPIFTDFKSHMQDLLSGTNVSPVTTRKATPFHQRESSTSSGWKKGTSTKHHEVETVQGVSVKLYSGNLTDQGVDVLVNLTSPDLNLKSGAVSASIAKAGGQSIQDDCKKLKPNGIECGELLETGAGKLKCKKIYHGTCSNYRVDTGKEEMMMYISGCLERAHQDKMQSIAFPSMGTGSLNFPAKYISMVMYNEVKKFSTNHGQTTLKDFRFVIFDGKIKKEYEKVADELPGKTRRLADDKKPKPYTKTDKKPTWSKKKWSTAAKQEVKFKIYGTNKSILQKVAKLMEDACKKDIMEKVIDNKDAIRKLSDAQKEQIKDLEYEHEVQISIEQGFRNKIVIQGPASTITEVVDMIYKIFREVDKSEMEQTEIELLRNTAHWQFEENGVWDEYPAEINAVIEKAHLDEEPFAQWKERNEQDTNVQSKRIDFSTKKETCTEDPSISFKVRRHVPGSAERSSKSTLPISWEHMKEGDKLKTPALKQGTQEYKDVVSSFDASMKKQSATYSKIVEIQRVQNPLLYRNFVTHKECMQKSNPHSKNPPERTLWHATGKDVLPEINMNGFNRSFSGDKYGAWYGKGCYFATHAGLSAKAYTDSSTKDKYMYRCRVLTGDYTKVARHTSIKTAPPKNPKNPAVKFDSVVDDDNSPNEWIIFTDAQAYPEYIVIFHL